MKVTGSTGGTWAHEERSSLTKRSVVVTTEPVLKDIPDTPAQGPGPLVCSAGFCGRSWTNFRKVKPASHPYRSVLRLQ